LANATLLGSGPYEIPNIKIDSYAVYTNHIPGGAFRGFGGPQGLFEAEQQMNKLAEGLNIDPVEIRMRNIFHEGSILSVMTPLPQGVSLPEVLARCATEAGWIQTANGWRRSGKQEGLEAVEETVLRRGFGIACGFKNIGFSYGAPERCEAKIELFGSREIDRVIVYHAGADVGQGAHTLFKQFAAEALGVPIERIELVVSDTAYTGNSGSSSASRMTFMAGNAIKGAARLALEKWNNEERPTSAFYQYRPPKTTPMDPQTGKSEPNFAYGYVAEGVEVEVDTETGQIQVIKVICVDDVGKAIHPQQVQGQVEGAIVQAAGYAILEDFKVNQGISQTSTLSTYLIPTILDIPEQISTVVIEQPDPIGPFGARGVGEMPYLPFVPALTAAVHSAVGIWFDEFPLTPERVLNGLDQIQS
jgi:CO/xanthine dehydrogenase Mo-binding subunit